MYRTKEMDKSLMLVEGLGSSYCRAGTSDRLDGESTRFPMRRRMTVPFAGISNVNFDDGVGPWIEDVSHGELARSGWTRR